MTIPTLQSPPRVIPQNSSTIWKMSCQKQKKRIRHHLVITEACLGFAKLRKCQTWCNMLGKSSLNLQRASPQILVTHYDDVRMGAIAYEITSLTIVYSSVYSGAYQSKHQSSASLAFVWRIHRGLVNSPHKWPVTRKMFPFDDVIMWPGGIKPEYWISGGWCWQVYAWVKH